MRRTRPSNNKPEANVPFSEFHSEVLSIYEAMDGTRQHSFRKAIGKYFKLAAEPHKGWSSVISSLLEGSEVSVTWPDKYLDDLRRGKASVTRSIACYYYLHSLTEDLNFAREVDEIVFSQAPSGERIFAETHRGRPLFRSPEFAAPTEDLSWKSARNQWAYKRLENRQVDSLFAQLSIERTQGGDTREPVALLAEVHIRPACERESGIELQFKSVDIVMECSGDSPSEIVYSVLRDEPTLESGHCFRLEGTVSGPYITLSNDRAGLDGTYVSGTIAALHPNCHRSEFSAENSDRWQFG